LLTIRGVFTTLVGRNDHIAEATAEREAQERNESGEVATALYDFDADGNDELSVKESERLIVLERDGNGWWKCRNKNGVEGFVPASYVGVRFAGRNTRANNAE